MKKAIKKSISLVLVLLMCMTSAPLGGLVDFDWGFSASALPVTGPSTTAEKLGENITHTIVDGVLTISGTGKMDNFSTAYESPLSSNNNITSVVIEEGITSIGDETFKSCYGITSVSLPSTLETIGEKAFNQCTGLTEIVIPDNVTTIGSYAFLACIRLETVKFGKSLKTIEAYAFDGCQKLETVTLGSSIETIGYGAFCFCFALTDIYYLGTAAQWESVTKGEDYISYTNGSTYEEEKEPATIICLFNESKKIGDNVYYYFDETTGKLTIGGTGATYDYEDDESNVSPLLVNYQDTVVSVTILDGVTSIGEYLLCCCSKLESVTVAGSVETIGKCAFMDCESLKEVNLLEGVKTIGYEAFLWTPIESINLPASLTTIDASAFNCCNSLAEITVADGSESFSAEDAVLFNKDKTKLIIYSEGKKEAPYTVPSTVTTIGKFAFENTSVSSVDIPEGVTTIDEGAFNNCILLSYVNVPSTVTSIGNNAFSGCGAAFEIKYNGTAQQWDNIEINDDNFNETVNFLIPSGKIGDNVYFVLDKDTDELTITGTGATYNYESDNSPLADDYKNDFTKVTIASGVTTIGDYLFYDNYKYMEEISIPDTVVSIGEGAFKKCAALKSITIPDSVTTIGKDAFSGCTGVESLHIGKGVTSSGYSKLENIMSGLKTITVSEDNTTFSAENNVLYNKDKTSILRYAPKQDSTTFIVPSTVTVIYSDVFDDCENLTDIYFVGTQDEWDNIYYEALPDSITLHCVIHLEHDYTADVTDPTCTEQGFTTHTCDCGESYVDSYVDALGHNFTDVEAKAATCLVAGNDAYKYCAACEKYFTADATADSKDGLDDNSTFTKAKLEHAYIGTVKMDADGKDGTHSYKCVNGCGQYGNTTAHTWGEGTVTKPATHLEKGVMAYECACGAKKTEDIAKLEGHTYSETVVDPTCTDKGYTLHKCACGDSYKDNYVDALGHSFTGDIKMDADGKDGTHSYACANGCGQYGNTTAHTWGEGTVTKSATHLEKGVMAYECTCGAKKTEDIAKLEGHTYSETVVEPTCTDKGYTLHKCACGDSYKDNYVDALGHNYDNGTCLNCGRPEPSNCTCPCHSNPIAGLIYMLINTIFKLFGSSYDCRCGAKH